MLISVVIPLYNKANTVKRTIDSVLNQTVLPLEIIVVNDGSTDGSELVVQQLDHSLIRLMHQDNGGVSAARNKGIEEAKGDWIAFLDADDYWDKRFIFEMFYVNKIYPNSKLIFCRYRFFADNVFLSTNIDLPSLHGICNNYFELALKGSPPIWIGAVVSTKKSLVAVGKFNQAVKIGEDLLIWAQLASMHEIAFLNKCLSNYNFPVKNTHLHSYRLPDENNLVSLGLQELYHKIQTKSEKRHLKKYIGKWHKMRLHLYAHHDKYKSAFKEYLLSLKYDFFRFKTHAIIPIYLFRFVTGINLIKNTFK
jgi:glycosyltransferase involved in cell wall biosynthesis